MSVRGSCPDDTVRVLHVVADAVTAERLAERLDDTECRYDVVTETDPTTALSRLSKTDFDCLVSAYRLPEMDGVEFLGAVRERDSTLPCLLFTGDGNEAVASRAISAGVTDYVRKHADEEGIDSLVDRIQTAVADSRSGSKATVRYGPEQFERFLHAFPDAVFVVDEAGRYLDCITGEDRSLLYDDVDALLGRRYHDVLPAETADRFLETVQQALATGEQQRIEYQLDVQGGNRWFEARVGPLETNSTRRTVFWVARDITERKQREREYEQIFNNANDAIAVFDPETGEITDVNPSYLDTLGYDDLETIRELGIEGVCASDDGAIGEHGTDLIRDVAETGEPETVEWQVETKEGMRRWLEATLAPAEIGGKQRVLSIQRDITERRELEQTYRDIFENVSDGLVVHDPVTGEILEVNEPYCELTGYDRTALLDESIRLIVPDDSEYTYADALERINEAREEGSQLFEFPGQTRHGERFIGEVHLSTIEMRGDERVLASVRDITERKRRERAIQALQEATERLQAAKTPEDVATIAVEAASDALDLPMTICWFHDADADQLDPVATTDPVREADLASGLSPDRYEYEQFLDGEVTQYTPSAHAAENPLETGVLLPLAEHGLIAAGAHEEVHADRTLLDLAKALADHVTTALDRVEREQAVRESERRFRLIAERIDEVIYLAEPDLSEVLYVNSAYEDVWGHPPEALYDDPSAFLDAVDRRDREAVESEFEAMIEKMNADLPAESYEFEFRLRQPSGEIRWVNTSGYTVSLSDEKHRFIGIAEDVTERKRREQRLEVFNRILRHNLRNELDVIKSHAEELADRTRDGHADRIIESVDELAAIGADARKTDRLISTPETLAELSLAETIDTVIDTIETDRHDVELALDVPTTATVTTNEAAIQLAIESALENALEYADTTVSVTVAETTAGYVVTIADDGPGIPPEQLVPIERGTETDLRHGTGLGLWRLKWCVETLNGELSFDTTDGTSVRIDVPDQRERHGTD